MEVKMIPLKDIDRETKIQCRKNFDHDKLIELANSIKEGELLQPIVVRKYDGKYRIVCGERRYRAFEYLKEPKIPAIIRDIKNDSDALEKGLIENWQRDDLTSTEREDAVGSLWDSDNYKNQSELARKLGVSPDTIEHLLDAREIRKKLRVPRNISTSTIDETKGLDNESRKKLIEQVDSGKIGTRELRDIVRKVKEFPEPEQQMEILEEFEKQEEQSKEVFDGIIDMKRKIAKGEIEPEHSLEKSADQIRADTLTEFFEKASTITSSYIKAIKSEKERERAIRFLKKTRDHIDKVLIGLGESKVISID